MNDKMILTNEYVHFTLDNLSKEDLQNFFYDRYFTEVSNWTMGELLDSVKEFAPELLD